MKQDTLVALVLRIDALLPQTQCRRCGYDGCLPYAEAIARGAAATNRCPPGGEQTAAALARLLALPPLPLDPSRGEPGSYAVARIDEAACIGCTLCIAACPVDAIVGAARLMHTVLADRCTGCALCLPPCPVNCIALRPAQRQWTPADADRARRHYAEQSARRLRRASRRGAPKASPEAIPGPDAARARRQAAVAAAFSRARARRAARSPARSRP